MSSYGIIFLISRVLEAGTNFLLLVALRSTALSETSSQIVAVGLFGLYSVFEAGTVANLSNISAKHQLGAIALTKYLLNRLLALAVVLAAVQLLLAVAIFRNLIFPTALWFVLFLSILNIVLIPSRAVMERSKSASLIYSIILAGNLILAIDQLQLLSFGDASSLRILQPWLATRLVPPLLVVIFAIVSRASKSVAQSETPQTKATALNLQMLTATYPKLLLSSSAGYLAYQSIGPVLAISSNPKNAAELVFQFQFFQTPFAIGCLTINAEINQKLRELKATNLSLENAIIKRAQIVSFTAAVCMHASLIILHPTGFGPKSIVGTTIFSACAITMQLTHYHACRLRIEKCEPTVNIIYLQSAIVVTATVLGGITDVILVIPAAFAFATTWLTRRATKNIYEKSFQVELKETQTQ